MVFSSQRFLQKMNEQILLYYYETLVQLVFVHFSEFSADDNSDGNQIFQSLNYVEVNFELALHFALKVS